MPVQVSELLTEPNAALVLYPGDDDLDRDTRFEAACERYPDAKVEMDEDGTIIVTPGSSEDSGFRSGEAFAQLRNWAVQDGTGRAFDSSTNFNLPSGAKRQPDAAWVSKAVLRQEDPEALRTITKPSHVPDYLIEVTSPSDTLARQKDKCEKWIAAGVKEVVLLHPKEKSAYVFDADGSVREMKNATTVPSRVLPGFVIDCRLVFEDL